MSRTFNSRVLAELAGVYDGVVGPSRGCRCGGSRSLVSHARRELGQHFQSQRRTARFEVSMRCLEVQAPLETRYAFIRLLLQQR